MHRACDAKLTHSYDVFVLEHSAHSHTHDTRHTTVHTRHTLDTNECILSIIKCNLKPSRSVLICMLSLMVRIISVSVSERRVSINSPNVLSIRWCVWFVYGCTVWVGGRMLKYATRHTILSILNFKSAYALAVDVSMMVMMMEQRRHHQQQHQSPKDFSRNSTKWENR